MSNEKKYFVPPTHEEIAAYAYQLWESEGRHHGRDQEYWLQAEAHLIADRRYDAGLLAPRAKPKRNSSFTVFQPAVKIERRGRMDQRSPAAVKQSVYA